MKKSEREDDSLLLVRIKNNDGIAFTQLTDKYGSRLRSLVSDWLDIEEDIEDLLQEIWIRFYSFLPGFREDAAIFTVLHTIARNTYVDILRKREREVETERLDYNYDDDDVLIDSILSSTEGAECLTEEVETDSKVRDAIESLPDNFREVIIMREYHGMSYVDIANELGCNIGTVSSRLNRARQLLKDYLVD